MILLLRKFIVVGLLLGLVSPMAYAMTYEHAQAPTHQATLLAFSDIHFDPFYTCTTVITPCPLITKLQAADYKQWQAILEKYDGQQIASYDKDTNYGLLKSALLAMHDTNQKNPVKFAIVLGDFLSHNFKFDYQFYSRDFSQVGYENFVRNTLAFLSLQIRQQLPNIPIYPVVGNNDSYLGDYVIAPDSSFFSDTEKTWLPLLANTANKNVFAREFPMAGYYEVTVPHESSHRIIVLNTVLFSRRAIGSNIDNAAQLQLLWLTTQLKQAQLNRQKVWLLFHVPPGIDAYAAASKHFNDIESYWQPTYTDEFLQIINNYSSVIAGIFSGHMHMDGFRLLGEQQQILDSCVSAISPIFSNNPAFKIYSYDPQTFRLENFVTYYLPESVPSQQVGTWHLEYSFNEIYQPGCKNCSLLQGMAKITRTGLLAEAYQRYYAVGNFVAQPITQGKWLPYYWCAISNMTEDRYQTCMKST